MDSVSHVVKSKSSYSAMTSKTNSDKKYKKSSGTSFAIQKFNHVKKRGVYVEKKSVKNENKKDNLPSTKIPSQVAQPRRNNKNFLSSVLSILSKSTTGTQYPDDPNNCNKNSDVNIRLCHSPKRSGRRAEVATLQMVTKNNPKRRNVTNNKTTKFAKPASKRVDDKTAVIVLQPKRQIIQTPSNYSERSYKDMTDPAVWNKLPCLVNYTDSGEYINDTEVYEQDLDTEIDNDESKEEHNVEIEQKDTESSSVGGKKSDKVLYNFFVDLLQTTISVYNMKPEYESPSKSNIKFEIEEEVANKLDVSTKKPTKPEVIFKDFYKKDLNQSLSDGDGKEFDNLLLSKYNDTAENSFRKIIIPARSKAARKYLYKSSVPYNTPTRTPHVTRRTRKRRFISLLKKELQMKDETYEEPQTLYDALKLIAKTKRKETAAVRSNPARRPDKDGECKFDINRRRNIMTPAWPKHHKKPAFDINDNHVNIKKSNSNRPVRKEFEKPVYKLPKKPLESLEVIGFDYQRTESKYAISEGVEASSSSSDSTVCNRFSFDTEWGDQSSKFQIYNKWLSGKSEPPWSDLKSYIYAEDD